MRWVPFAIMLGCQTETDSEPAEDCGTLSEGAEADKCHYAEMQLGVKASDLEAAQAALARISDPLLASAGANEILSTWEGDGLSLDVAMSLCSSLAEGHQTPCRKTWNRPHLWVREARTQPDGQPKWPAPGQGDAGR